MIQQLPKAPVNLSTGSIELTIEPNDLLDLKYYNLYADSGGPATVNTCLLYTSPSPRDS